MGAIGDEDLLKTLGALADSINKIKPDTISAAQIAAAKKQAGAILAKTPAVLAGSKSTK